ncbi:hypothetical protein GLOTRDRAFT_32103 [Gloeophyllum trabeum ATCC 11539]|uniref:Uncharacterized protein n=1 Tax=Gloeophyllum trabeum (strain ATCC 11539 / FP-39264 / Madison 617) TaxID=670483 RepID=S7QJZ6_GLOTA|nr:uncharacterized protein GLOTRDRAFT_32103 [Gloeophyllum trabeum ATCC 11539]EPQ60041.1 hypothetical protein GLOTRDRAFT_32103 [Gloeophyllum trabeum ATCC 11539]
MSGTAILFALACVASALNLPRQFNDGVRLAISPSCGTIGGTPANVNAGLLPLNEYKNIVVFGDGYSSNGVTDGSNPAPPVVVPPSPKAGGRMSDGYVWTEYLANDSGATLNNYAVSFELCPAVFIDVSFAASRLTVLMLTSTSGRIQQMLRIQRAKASLLLVPPCLC